ncbi:MAG: Holliday junction branch migration protein RuvA [Clostridiales bacterium]|nr:Holliday junction branch migration protein RuvA [Clostridiales bacterium]
MIGFLNGILTDKDYDNVTIECNGVGFLVYVTNSCMVDLPSVGEQVKIYTYLNINKENEISLFGFSSREEKRLFLQLITVSGVGSKTALQILSCERMGVIVNSIINEDPNVIGSCKGIGKKTAERIILELKDKIKPFDYILPNDNILTATVENNQAIEDASVVLMSLGLNRNKAMELAKQCAEKHDTAEQIVAKALHQIGG